MPLKSLSVSVRAVIKLERDLVGKLATSAGLVVPRPRLTQR